MKRRWSILVALLVIEHSLFVTLSVWLAPTELSFFALFLTWMILPAFTAAVACSAVRHHIISAAANGVVAATLLDYLFLVHGYYWPERPEIETTLALSYLSLGVGVSTSCGAFVHVITASLKDKPDMTTRQRLMIATKKGLTFSSLCVTASLPVLWMVLPAHTLPQLLSISLGYSVCGIAGGGLVACVVSAMYTVPQSPVG
ncbi:MAG: hypothetical protein R3C17_08720 [Planctomycetaceae bacterium]